MGEHEKVIITVKIEVESKGEQFIGHYYKDTLDPLVEKIIKVISEQLSNENYTVGVFDTVNIEPQ